MDILSDESRLESITDTDVLKQELDDMLGSLSLELYRLESEVNCTSLSSIPSTDEVYSSHELAKTKLRLN